jgi:predicted permease
MALRAALGSGRGRIVAGLLVETAILAGLGGAAGVALGWTGVRGLLALSPDALPMVAEPRLSPGVLAFALAATVLALVVAGLAPALRLSRTPPADVLRSAGRSATGGRRLRRLRDALAVVQVAAALVLVAGAALLGRSFAELRDVPLRMEPEGVLAFEVHLPQTRYPDGAAREAFHRALRERVSALPEVEAAGAVSWLPLNGRYHIWGVYWDPERPDGSNEDAWRGSDMRIFSGGYLDALGIQVVRGARPGDVDLEAEPVAWVNQQFVDEVFGETDPLGQLIRAANGEWRIAGVVADVPYDAQGGLSPTTYLPHEHYADNRNWALTQTVRARGDLTDLRERVRGILAGIDPQLVLYRPRPLERVVATARAQDRFATALMGAFAFLALALSLVGTYGVLAGAVAGRTREFGIRMALGADRGAVRAMILTDGARLVGVGLALGLVGTITLSGLMATQLYDVNPRDPGVLAAVSTMLLAVGLLASFIPAWRATLVDPVTAMRGE